MKYVQFSDESETLVVSVFASVQASDAWPNQGEVEDDDSRYLAYLKSLQPSPVLQRDSLMAVATVAIAPLQDAVDLDEATAAEVTLLKKWKKYRVDLSRLDLSSDPAVWPALPV